MGTFLLVDGAQLAADEDFAKHLSDRRCEHVYADLGDPAGRMGPIVTVADQSLMCEAADWESGPPRRHAIACLDSSVGLTELGMHLRSVRYVHLHERRQHFLRYADTRTMQGLMQVLTPAQSAGLFGPVSTWQLRDRDGAKVVFEKPAVAPAPQRLRLSSAQGQRLLDISRPDQLLADVLEDEPAFAEIGNEGQRHAWMAQAWQLLEENRWRAHSTRLAVAHTALRTSGAALNDDGFLHVLRSAAEWGETEVIYSWSPATPEPEHRDD